MPKFSKINVPFKLSRLMIALFALLIVGLFAYFIFSQLHRDKESAEITQQNKTINRILSSAKRIKTSDGWFEVIKLPHDVYAFYEPGHAEKVNSFLIVGTKKDLLFDTGMGIANIKKAIDEVREQESLPSNEIIVVNSHSHLDHKGSNAEFPAIYIYKSQWARQKQTAHLKPGAWETYYGMLTGLVKAPVGFDPKTFTYPATKEEQIHYLKNDDVIDLGNRKFIVLITHSHTPDSIVLYDPKDRLLFSGDAFGPDGFLVRDMDILATDLEMFNTLNVDYHYNTHGKQLIAPGLRKKALLAIGEYQKGNYTTSTASYGGRTFKVFSAGGMRFGFAPCFMMEA